MYTRIEILKEKKLVGKRMRMSLSLDKTFELWHGFMLRRKEIIDTVSGDLYSVKLYDKSYDFKTFNPDVEFEKLAAMEVTGFETIPPGMEQFRLTSGLYAVFVHKGTASKGPETFRYIFGTWLPDSGYSLDYRPHFEILGEKYKRDDPTSEEEIWIPVKHKE